MIGPHTPLSEVPLEWLAEIEWRVARPLGWNDHWYITPRDRKNEQTRDAAMQTTWQENPRIRVKEYVEGKGWRSKQVRARLYIAEMFFEWDGIEDPAHGHVSGYKHPKYGKNVVIEKPRSHWECSMTCGDPRCINPMHIGFKAAGGLER